MAWPRSLQLRRHFQRVVLARPWLTFVVLGLAFSCFGMVTLNLVHLLRANAELYGLDVKTFAMAQLRTDYRAATKQRMPRHWFDDLPHSHVALDDAIEQGALFCNMLRDNRQPR